MSNASYDRRTASGKFDLDTVLKIKQLTKQNDHVESLILGAKMLGLTALVKKLELVSQLQRLEGFLPHPLGEYKHFLYKGLMEHAKRVLPPEEYDQFYGSY